MLSGNIAPLCVPGRGPVSPKWNTRSWKRVYQWHSPPMSLHPPHLESGASLTSFYSHLRPQEALGWVWISVSTCLMLRQMLVESSVGHTPIPEVQSTERLMPFWAAIDGRFCTSGPELDILCASAHLIFTTTLGSGRYFHSLWQMGKLRFGKLK